MSAAPSGPDDGYGDVRDDPSEGPVDAGDLLDDPRTDVEALCLCSLLWSSSPVARTITDALTPGDFERQVYRDLFGPSLARSRLVNPTIRRVSPL
jgi:hypothetical protein